MERMWRKVNHSFGGRASKVTASTVNNATIQSTDTVSSAGGFGDGQIVVAVATNMPSSTATGRRLASSGGQISSKSSHMMQKSLSQHVLHQSTASSERRRRRRRKSRARRSGGGVTSCVSGGGDNMSSSGGFYTIKENSIQGSNHHHNRQSQSSSRMMLMASSAPSGTVMMYPNYHSQVNNSRDLTSLEPVQVAASTTAVPTTSSDISLRQRAVAKLRMFNFHLNWDLHMTHCKPCGPRIGSGGGNIITRRLCRNRRREDNELYRSNSFKFERFERKECIEELTNTLQKQIAICDDYSLPVDFVKKRPSSFDPCLADAIPTNPENWTAPSPQAEFSVFTEGQQQNQNQQSISAVPPPLPPPPLSTLPIAANTSLNQLSISNAPNHTLPNNSQQRYSQSVTQTNNVQLKSNSQHSQQTIQRPAHPPLPNTIKQACVKLIEGYSDPKDSKRHKKVYHKKGKRRVTNKNPQQTSQAHKQHDKPQSNTNNRQQLNPIVREKNNPDKRNTYSSDSSAPKSSDDEDNHSLKIPELNSPDSISDDLIRPLPAQLHRSPRKLTVAANAEHSKRNPSPYYYSDLLKSKDVADTATDKEVKNKSRQSTASEPPQLTQGHSGSVNVYRKSSSLDAPEREGHIPTEVAKEVLEFEEDLTVIDVPSGTELASKDTDLKRYSFTEEGVHIIRCESPSTSTSDESDCSECLKRREWHARALALVRKTCNVQPLNTGSNGELGQAAVEENIKCTSAAAGPADSQSLSMPPHRLLGPAVCACVAPPSTIGDDLDEYFRPRSVFYVHPNGIHECADCCSPDAKNLSAAPSRSLLDTSGSLTQSNDVLIESAILDEADRDEMSGRMRQIYETAFDCKVAKSDDDLDEVDRITNHSVMLQMNNGNSFSPKSTELRTTKSTSQIKSRLEGKRLKNSKNQAIQEQASNSGGNASSSGSPLTVGGNGVRAVRSTEDTESALNISASALSTELANAHICEQTVDQQNNASISTSQLPMRGYTPSPPSTAPLPIKFPGKHDRFFMNSIKSAPNLPSSNPAHPRLRDLRLPIQSSLRQQQQQQPGSSLGTSNENSLTDSAYVNPPSSDAPHKRHAPKMGVSKHRDRPRSFVLESGRVLELRKGHAVHHRHVGNGGRRQHNYSSTESIATSSGGGSMESLRSSTSEGNRSTSSSESRHSTSLSSHGSESGSSSVAFPLRPPVVIHSKLHILSPISDKSSQEPASELSEQNKTQNPSPEEITHLQPQPQTLPPHQKLLQQVSQNMGEPMRTPSQLQLDALKKRRAVPQNKTLLHLTDEILGSDSGISLHSREDGKATSGIQKFTLPKLNFPLSDKGPDSGLSAAGCVSNSVGLPQDLRDLPFDMPKLRRRKTLQQDACTSGSATSVDLGDLPFDMPKLRRRLRANQTEINNLMVHSTESSGISQASSSHSMRDDNKTAIKLDSAIFRQNLTLNLNEPRQTNKFGSLDLRGLSSNKELNLNLPQGQSTAVDMIDISIPLERQGWYHGAITRIDAESTLRPLDEGSFLVRNCESTKQDYSLSLKGAKGFMHMRIQRNETGQYILGQFSRPFETVPDMIRHFCLNRLPVRGAEHMCLIEPVIAQLL